MGLLDLALAAEPDTRALVDLRRLQIKNALTLVVDGETAGLLDDHSHWEALVQQSQLALTRLLVGRVGEQPAIKNRAVHVGNHGADIPRRVRLALLGELERVEKVLRRLVPVHGVALVDRIDVAELGHAQTGVRQNELPERVIQREAVHVFTNGEHKVRRGTVHGVPSSNELVSGTQHVLGSTLGVVVQAVDAENRAHRNTGIQVRGAVNWVTDYRVAALAFDVDKLLLLLGNDQLDGAGRLHGVHKDVVSDHVELLLVVSGAVGSAGETHKVHKRGPADVVRNVLERELQRVQQQSEVTSRVVMTVLALDDEPRQSNDVCLYVVVSRAHCGDLVVGGGRAVHCAFVGVCGDTLATLPRAQMRGLKIQAIQIA